MSKIFIGVGHGGKDSGAVANGFKEKDLNLSIALACKMELERNGISVAISRIKDEDDTLTEEIKECNAYKPDLALDIHNNAGGGDGAEVLHYSKGGKSKTLAQNILSEIVAIGQNSRGLKTKLAANGTDYFGFIREINAPSVIVECAFVDNKTDLQIIDTETERKVMGIAIAKGVMRTLGITPKSQPTSQPTQPTITNKLYRVRKSKDDAKSQIGAYGSLDNAKTACDKAGVGYKVFDWNYVVVYEYKTPTAPTPVIPVVKPSITEVYNLNYTEKNLIKIFVAYS